VIPEDLRYTSQHEWIAPGGGAVKVGITDFAQGELGDIVFVELPEPGRAVTAGEPFAEVESTKSVSEIYAPITGTVVARNEALTGEPELINSDPYGGGWLVQIEPANAADVDQLLDAAGYSALIEQS
jgi:glycine cleavage system H protein